MSTGIEWTDETWNPVRGCTKVSAGCDNCYAMSVAHRFSGAGQPYEGLTRKIGGRPQWNGKVRLVPELLDQPLRWKHPRRIFVNSMSDLFHPDVPDDFIDRVFAIMALAPNHTFQILTKRPERMREYMAATLGQWHGNTDMFADRFNAAMDWNFAWINDIDDMPWPLPNVWLGTSVEDQAAADERIPHLLETPAAVRFLSCEPLLGPVNLEELPSASGIGRHLDALSKADDPGAIIPHKIDWVIVGGESGPRARPMHPDWVRSLRDQCQAAGVPFFFKQWGDWGPAPADATHPLHCDCTPGSHNKIRVICKNNGTPLLQRVGKKRAGRLLDGRSWDEYPEAAA